MILYPKNGASASREAPGADDVPSGRDNVSRPLANVLFTATDESGARR